METWTSQTLGPVGGKGVRGRRGVYGKKVNDEPGKLTQTWASWKHREPRIQGTRGSRRDDHMTWYYW